MGLKAYHQKRQFSKTAEPKGQVHREESPVFVVQKHAASHLHYDFRLSLVGVLKSWSVPKGPCCDPTVKRLAMHVEDHPLEYGSFEGIIPQGQYGGGTVMLWDHGTWTSLDEDPLAAYKNGHLRFQLKGKKLKGRWDLIQMHNDEKSWFLVKIKDKEAKSLKSYDITLKKPLSVTTRRTLDEIAADAPERIKKKSLLIYLKHLFLKK